MSIITVRPGETVTVVGIAGDGGGGQPPLGIWGPGDPRPTNPIAGPGRGPNWGMANDPGYSPPWAQVPGGGGGGPPLVIWGPGDPRPTLPIAGWNPGTGNFPELPGEIPELGQVEWKAIWTPQTGWAVIGIPTGPVPTPST